MITGLISRPYDPAPEGFARRYIMDGWRGVERYYGARTERNKRWLKECGGSRIVELRRRYLQGDLGALSEIERKD